MAIIKKIIKFVFVSLFVLLITAVLAVFIFIKTFDVNKFKPQIISKIENSINRKVELENIGLNLSFKNGVNLSIENFKIKENKEFFNGDLFSVKKIFVDLSLKDLVKNRKIHLLSINIKSPVINVVKTKSEKINLLSLSAKDEKAGQNKSVSSPIAAIMLINNIDITDATVVYNDLSTADKLVVELNKINLSVKDFGFNKNFKIKADMAYLSNVSNINFEAVAEIDIAKKALRIRDAVFNTDLSSFSFNKLKKDVSLAEKIYLPKELKGKIKVSIGKLNLTQKDVELNADISLQEGLLKVKEIKLPFSKIKFKAEILENDFIIDNFSSFLGDGKINLSGKIDNIFGSKNLSLKADISDIDISQVIEQSSFDFKVEGMLSGRFDIVSKADSSFLTDLKGVGEINLKNGKILDFNILKMVLEKLSFIPDLAYKLEQGLPEKYKKKLNNKDTVVGKLYSSMQISDKILEFKQIDLDADDFVFNGKGRLNFDQVYNLEGFFMIPQELSLKMTEEVSDLQALFDENNRIVFPLEVSGRGKKISFKPNIESVAQSMIENRMQKEIGKLLDKVIEKDSSVPKQSQSPNSLPQTQQQNPKETEKSPKQQLIEGVLDAIFN